MEIKAFGGGGTSCWPRLSQATTIPTWRLIAGCQDPTFVPATSPVAECLPNYNTHTHTHTVSVCVSDTLCQCVCVCVHAQRADVVQTTSTHRRTRTHTDAHMGPGGVALSQSLCFQEPRPLGRIWQEAALRVLPVQLTGGANNRRGTRDGARR